MKYKYKSMVVKPTELTPGDIIVGGISVSENPFEADHIYSLDWVMNYVMRISDGVAYLTIQPPQCQVTPAKELPLDDGPTFFVVVWNN